MKTMRDASEVIAAVVAEMRKARGTLSRDDYDMRTAHWADRLEATLPASTPPGDACVRHACKRVRMEMQARIDALSQPAAAEVDLLDALLKRPNRVWQSSGHYSAELARGIVVDPIELRALVKGDSHAG